MQISYCCLSRIFSRDCSKLLSQLASLVLTVIRCLALFVDSALLVVGKLLLQLGKVFIAQLSQAFAGRFKLRSFNRSPILVMARLDRATR